MKGKAAIAEATRDENVWHCSLSLPPDAAALDDATWSAIAHGFMEGMGFDDPDAADARWVAIRHGVTTNGGDHIHIAASRVRDDGSVVAKWRPHPTRGGNEGDYGRAQRVARDLEAKYGMEVLSSYTKNMAARGRSHAQDAATRGVEGAEPRIAEAPSVMLARRVRVAAAAAESEAEFVRLVRADGLVIRSARYDKSDPNAVTGFSVGLPASEYANKHGQPVMHGGKKLAEDLSLPRLREGWIDDDKSRADARSAWDHADERAPGTHTRRDTGTASRTEARTADTTTTERDATTRGEDTDVSARLRTILSPLARGVDRGRLCARPARPSRGAGAATVRERLYHRGRRLRRCAAPEHRRRRRRETDLAQRQLPRRRSRAQRPTSPVARQRDSPQLGQLGVEPRP